MLLVSRGRGEAIIIGKGSPGLPDGIVVRIKSTTSNRAGLAIDVPRHLTVYREEVQQRIDRGEPKPEPKPPRSLARTPRKRAKAAAKAAS